MYHAKKRYDVQIAVGAGELISTSVHLSGQNVSATQCHPLCTKRKSICVSRGFFFKLCFSLCLVIKMTFCGDEMVIGN